MAAAVQGALPAKDRRRSNYGLKLSAGPRRAAGRRCVAPITGGSTAFICSLTSCGRPGRSLSLIR